MNVAKVVGHATASVKHQSMQGWRLLVVQPLGMHDSIDGYPFLAIDRLGSAIGDQVLITSDGKEVRMMMGSDQTPVRWAVIGIVDPTHSQSAAKN